MLPDATRRALGPRASTLSGTPPPFSTATRGSRCGARWPETTEHYAESMNEILSFLNSRSNFDDAGQVETFELYIEGRRVRVEVLDRGDAAGSVRYSVTAFMPDVPEADREVNSYALTVGNPEATVRDALLVAHWNVFESSK